MIGSAGAVAASASAVARIASAPPHFGSISASGRMPASRIASRSRNPSAVVGSLIRRLTSARTGARSAKSAMAAARASSFAANETPSSRSMQTASAPVASAFG